MPSLTHQTARGDRLPRPTLAKGVPLSVRMASGSPYSRKARYQDSARLRSIGSIQSSEQASRYHDAAILHGKRVDPDAISRPKPPLEVNGPDVVGPIGSGKGLAPGCCVPATLPTSHQPRCGPGCPRRCWARATDSLGSATLSQATSFFGPQVGWACLAAISRSAEPLVESYWDGGVGLESSRRVLPSHKPHTAGHACSRSCG